MSSLVAELSVILTHEYPLGFGLGRAPSCMLLQPGLEPPKTCLLALHGGRQPHVSPRATHARWLSAPLARQHTLVSAELRRGAGDVTVEPSRAGNEHFIPLLSWQVRVRSISVGFYPPVGNKLGFTGTAYFSGVRLLAMASRAMVSVPG